MPRILVNGVGTIGKRIAEAVDKQDDMKLAGVADVSPTPDLRTVLGEEGPLHGTPLYGTTPDGVAQLRDAGMDVEAKLEDTIEDVDLVVDCTPGGVEVKNKENLYEPNDTRAVFQGGSDASVAPVSFNAQANYEDAAGEQYARVVSCNTTSLCRTLDAADINFGVEEAVANLVRRGGDPKQDSRGPINSILPVQHVPSHHGPDVQEVMPSMDITTLAVKVPTTLAHVHMVNADLETDISTSEAVDVFEETPRVRLLEAGEGYDSTATVTEQMRDLERPRYDMWEAGVWDQTVKVEDGTLYWMHMVHQESIVVPDNIDAIRSMLDMAEKEESIRATDRSLGMR